MPTYGSPSMRVRVSTASGADAAHDISDYIRSLSGIQTEALLQEGTAFGESWVKHHFVGVRQGAAITMAGYYETAAGSPHSYFGQPGDIGAERMLEFSFTSTPDTFRTPAKLMRYSRMPTLGGLVEWEAEWSPTGTPTTYPGEELIAEYSHDTPTSSVTFTLPTNYTHLRLLAKAQTNSNSSANVHLYARFNGDNATNYSWAEIRGLQTAATGIPTDGDAGVIVGSVGTSAGEPLSYGHTDCLIFDYNSTKSEKNTISDFEVRFTGFHATIQMVGWWKSTAPITTILLYAQGGDQFTSDSQFNLYGVP